MLRSLLDLIGNVIFLIMEPLSMIKLLFQLCMRIVCFVTLPWLGLAKIAINMVVHISWRLITWNITVISIPIRIVTALQREKLLESRLQQLQTHVEALNSIKRDLEHNLELAIRDHKRVEVLLAEADEDHGKAIEKIQQLEIRVRDLEAENSRLIEGEKRLFMEAQVDKNDIPSLEDECGTDADVEDIPNVPWNSKIEIRGKLLRDCIASTEGKDYHSKMKFSEFDPLWTKSSNFSYNLYSTMEKQEVKDETIYQCRGIALMQSTFSACLSLLVGMTAWEAQDPCMPLVVALFIVVGMSLKSVVQYFSKIQNRPGSDAVALLSFNWFILGTLVCPALPNVAKLLSPMAYSLGCRIAGWFGVPLVG